MRPEFAESGANVVPMGMLVDPGRQLLKPGGPQRPRHIDDRAQHPIDPGRTFARRGELKPQKIFRPRIRDYHWLHLDDAPTELLLDYSKSSVRRNRWSLVSFILAPERKSLNHQGH